MTDLLSPSRHAATGHWLLAVAGVLVVGIGGGLAWNSFVNAGRDSAPVVSESSMRPAQLTSRVCSRKPLRRRYVSSSGRDSNGGTVKHPWRTVQKAVRAARPGDEILVRGGTYGEDTVASSSGTSTAPISLRAYGREHPVMTGRLKITGAYVCVDGFRFERSPTATQPSVLIYVSAAHHVEIRGNEIRDSSMSGIYVGDEGEPSEDVSIIGNYIHGNGTHARLDHGVYAGTLNGGLIANNLVVDNLALGLKLAPEANRITVTQNTVVGNGLAGIAVGGEGRLTSNDNLLVNNIVAFSDGWGIRTYWEDAVGNGNLALRNLLFGNRAGAFWFPGGGLIEDQSILADPKFDSGNFRLRPGSPAVNRAVARFSMAVDFDARARPVGAAPDLGAYER